MTIGERMIWESFTRIDIPDISCTSGAVSGRPKAWVPLTPLDDDETD